MNSASNWITGSLNGSSCSPNQLTVAGSPIGSGGTDSSIGANRCCTGKTDIGWRISPSAVAGMVAVISIAKRQNILAMIILLRARFTIRVVCRGAAVISTSTPIGCSERRKTSLFRCSQDAIGAIDQQSSFECTASTDNRPRLGSDCVEQNSSPGYGGITPGEDRTG